jgi:hypothetical protein
MWERKETPDFQGSPEDHKVMKFLDDQYKKHGKDSVFYIRYGYSSKDIK